ncbi:MAG: DNA polymerase III subunit delta [Crocinitomicaceae bacterium]|nr:DNA polymerase III subunit delta [Crocinitomicaceae bacterium]
MLFKEVLGHKNLKEQLIAQVTSNRVSHAQLLLGPEGSGKLPLAISFAQYLLCDNPTDTDSCGECQHCTKVKSLTHPDLHFSFPVVVSKTDGVSTSDDLRSEWNQLVSQQPYFSLNSWLKYLDDMGKNPIINVEGSSHILRKLSLKSYSDKYKIMIIWMAEQMNTQAANKLLKLIEEPPEQTIFLLIADNAETILPTIISRTQIINVPGYSTDEVASFLETRYQIEAGAAQTVAGLSQGNVVDAIETVQGDSAQSIYFELFVKLMRSAYAANPNELIEVAEEISLLERESQKNFIRYGLHIFRESIIMNYLKDKTLSLRDEELNFLNKFARFINNQNITEISEEFNLAYYHIERNANPKILFTDLVIKLTKLIRKGV